MLISAAQTLFAIATIWIAGLAALRLIAPPSESGPMLERIGLSWLIGGGWISVMIAGLGTFLHGAVLIAGVLVSIGVLIFAGRQKSENTAANTKRFSIWEVLLLGIIAAQVVTIGIFASKVALGWDALMTWEWKSRLAFLNGGSLPAAYFSDPRYDLSLPRYPLQLPYVGSWLYLCLGRFDQAWIRVIGPFYYLAGIFVVAGACQRLHGSRPLGLCAGAAMFFVPYFFAGTWGMFAGYADLPLGVLLVAAVSRIPAESGAAQARLLGILAALLPWMKREGQHLWVIVMVLALIQVWQAKAWKRLPWIVLPGILVIIVFHGLLALLQAVPYSDVVTVSMGQLGERLGRLSFVGARLFAKALDFEAWSLLWPGALAAAVALLFQRRYQFAITFGGALVLCWLLLGTGYIVGFPHDFESMIAVTIDRIVLQFAPLAVLTIVLAVPPPMAKTEN